MPQVLNAMAKNTIKADPRYKNLVQCIDAVWQYIGSDSEQCAEECGEPLNNEGRLEGCLDADRMTMYVKNGGKEADAYSRELFDLFGYPAVLKFLNREVRL